MARIMTTLVILSLGLPAASTAALRTIAPPGDSAVSQYVESVPTAKGQRPTSSLGNQAPANQASPLTQSQQQALDHAGSGGRTLVAVVDATSPAVVAAHHGRGARGHRAGGSGVAGLPPEAISGKRVRSPASALLAAASGGGAGMGVLLPVIMLAALLGVIAAVVVRSRRTPPS